MDAETWKAWHVGVSRRVSLDLSVTLNHRELRELRGVFETLDEDGSGAIGVEELQDPLIGLGFAENVYQVRDMIDRVDDDKSGQIEFPEFLKIIKGNDDPETRKISWFFKDLCSGKFGNRDVSFPVFVNQMKRRSLLDAIKAKDPQRKFEGNKILINLKAQLKHQKTQNDWR
jgi:hypothetical protein